MHLTPQIVAQAALQAHADKKLIAQHPVRFAQADYHIDDCYCAIGAALDPQTIQRIEDFQRMDGDYSDIDCIADQGLVEVESEQHRSALRKMQQSHDRWLSDPTPVREGNFLSLLHEYAQ